MRRIVLDTETTGLRPEEGHKIVEIGCLELDNHIPTGEFFHIYINPMRNMPRTAYEIHGLDIEFLKGYPIFLQQAHDFLNFIGKDPLIIHNAKFDIKFLNAELEAINMNAIPLNRAIDTLKLAREKFPGSPASLDALCKKFKIDLSKRNLHGALLDAQLLAKVYLELIGGAQPEFFDLPQNYNQAAGQPNQDNISQHITKFPLRNFTPTDNELLNHDKTLSKITNPIWKK